MAFDIELIKNKSDNRTLNKSLEVVKTASGTLKESSSIIDPVITITGLTNEDVRNINYMKIASFGRYYFVKDITCLHKSTFQISAHVDVLKSFEDEIKNLNVVALRQKEKCDLFIPDSEVVQDANRLIFIKRFPGTFGNSREYLLAVAGS